VIEEVTVTRIIVDAAKKVLLEQQQRCAEALKALDQQDYLVALGALAGVENELRYVSTRLMVLRELEITKKRRRNHGC
jgi:hypothetical protein